MRFATKNGRLNSNLEIKYNFSASETLLDFEKIIAQKSQGALIYGIPFLSTIKLKAIVKSSIDAELNSSASGSLNTDFTIGAEYNNGTWSFQDNMNPVFSYNLQPLKDKISGNLEVIIVPIIEVKLAGAVGPEAELQQKNKLEGSVSLIDKQWQIEATGNLDGELRFDMSIFDELIEDQKKEFQLFDWTYYNSPDSIALVSGGDQEFVEGEYLPEPIKIKVYDSYGDPQSKVWVKFELGTEDDQLDGNTELQTNQNGEVEVRWKPKDDESVLKAIVKNPDGNNIKGGPVEVKAIKEQSIAYRLANGLASPKDILNEGHPKDSLYLKFYGGGFIVKVNSNGSGTSVLWYPNRFATDRWAQNNRDLHSGATGEKVGDGLSNTIKICQAHREDTLRTSNTVAGRVRWDNISKEESDYYLPSKREIDMLASVYDSYKEGVYYLKHMVPAQLNSNPDEPWYWSSTESSVDDDHAWAFNCRTRQWSEYSKHAIFSFCAFIDFTSE
jgi:hypothetical protein